MDANQIQNLFASNVRQLLVDADLDYDKLYEIRLRVGRPLFLTYDGGECFLRQKDTEPYLVTREDLKETLEYVSGYSLYAYEDEIRQGFLSVQGGHRVGVTGKVILDGCPKAEGMQMLIRSMSPVVVAVDELGKEEDFKAVESVIHCGCRLIATAHGASMEETLSQPFFRKLWEARVFQRYIFLGKHERAGIVEGIYDENGKCLCTGL